MPWLSKKQEAWGHSPSGLKALGGPASVREWDAATNQKSLPERVTPMADKPKHWMQGAIKDNSHPVKRAAERKGISTLQEAEREAESSNPHIRGRGLFGVRLIRGRGKP
jgi:hypothetical protein